MAGLVAGACVSEPQVNIALERSEDLVLAPDFLRFAFHTKDDVIETPITATGAAPRNAFLEIPPTVSFSIDVIGCPSNVAEECEEPAQFIARGCDGPFSRSRDQEPFSVTIVLEPPAVGNADCPVDIE